MHDSPHRLVVGVAVAAFAIAPLLAVQHKPPAKGTKVAVVAVHDSDLLTLCPNVLDPHVAAASRRTPADGAPVMTVTRPDVATATSGSVAWTRTKGVDFHVVYPRPGLQHVSWFPAGTRMSSFVMLPISEASPPGLAVDMGPSVANRLDRLAPDPLARESIEQQFRDLKTYQVVASPHDADIVFLAESRYAPLSVASGTYPVTPASLRPAITDRKGSGPGPEAIFNAAESEWRKRQFKYGDNMEEYLAMVAKSRPQPQTAAAGPRVTVATLGGDRFAGWRESMLAIAIPASRYQGVEGDGVALSAAATWAGVDFGFSAAGFNVNQGSAESLVAQFHGKGTGLPAYMPVCGVARRILEPLADSAPRSSAAPGSAGVLPDPPPDTAPVTFRSSVTLVSVPTTVSARDGHDLGPLEPSAFHLFEDGVEQKVERLESGTVPTDVVLLLDTSSGMRDVVETVRHQARTLVGGLRADDRVLVASFDRNVRVLSNLTANRSETEAALGRLVAAGNTRLYDAIALSVVDRLRTSERRKVIILLTDGIDNASRLTGARGALAAIDSENVSVYAVRYDTSDAPTALEKVGTRLWRLPDDTQKNLGANFEADLFLQHLADDSGGRFYQAKPAADVQELFSTIARDLYGQYLLRYYPKNDRMDGTYRTITVTVDRPDATVRARAGYRAGVAHTGR